MTTKASVLGKDYHRGHRGTRRQEKEKEGRSKQPVELRPLASFLIFHSLVHHTAFVPGLLRSIAHPSFPLRTSVPSAVVSFVLRDQQPRGRQGPGAPCITVACQRAAIPAPAEHPPPPGRDRYVYYSTVLDGVASRGGIGPRRVALLACPAVLVVAGLPHYALPGKPAVAPGAA
jgi:hypothetical protein